MVQILVPENERSVELAGEVEFLIGMRERAVLDGASGRILGMKMATAFGLVSQRATDLYHWIEAQWQDAERGSL